VDRLIDVLEDLPYLEVVARCWDLLLMEARKGLLQLEWT
jgi:hypothetical protein